MFGTHLLDRRSRPERVADQAWEYLLSAAGSAKDTAKDTARSARNRTSDLADFAGDAGDLVGSAADEARRRATLAFDALAGRKVSNSTPWTLILVAGLVGAAIGWAAGTASRAAMARFTEGDEDERPVDSIEFVDVDRAPGSTAGA